MQSKIEDALVAIDEANFNLQSLRAKIKSVTCMKMLNACFDSIIGIIESIGDCHATLREQTAPTV